MTLHKTQAEAEGAAAVIALGEAAPVVVTHAAFEISPACYDEITRILRDREYHHVFSQDGNAIYMDNIALTRGRGVEPDTEL